MIVWRPGPSGTELLWTRRSDPLRFAGGFFAFPGGKVDASDHLLPVLNVPDAAVPDDPPAAAPRPAQLAGAVRELFEETGILLVREGPPLPPAATRDGGRRALLAGATTFVELLRAWNLAVDASLLKPAGRWITPPYSPVRFDAQFFLAALPAGQTPDIWPGELTEGAFVSCEEALTRWRRGEALLHPPIRWALQVLARHHPTDAAEDLARPPYCDRYVVRRIDFQEGLWLVPQRTATLPPATHTNCYVVDVGDGLAVVDPGASDPAQQTSLESLLAEFAAEGRKPREIWLTHHHADHIGGVDRLARARDLPIVCHALTADRLDPALSTRIIGEGSQMGQGWRALHTPGHARGHLSFHHVPTGALLCGDMVSTLSTIVIDPPEGDMTEYLRQLQRLQTMAPRTLYPAHGPPTPNAAAKLGAYLAHRQAREEKVLAAITTDGATLAEITARAYDDTPAALHPLAARSCLASLEKLVAEGRAAQTGDRFARA